MDNSIKDTNESQALLSGKSFDHEPKLLTAPFSSQTISEIESSSSLSPSQNSDPRLISGQAIQCPGGKTPKIVLRLSPPVTQEPINETPKIFFRLRPRFEQEIVKKTPKLTLNLSPPSKQKSAKRTPKIILKLPWQSGTKRSFHDKPEATKPFESVMESHELPRKRSKLQSENVSDEAKSLPSDNTPL